MSALLAIDSGKRSGFAAFLSGRLVAAGTFDPDELAQPPFWFQGVRAQVVVERPRVRPGNSLGSENGLITLGIRAGLVGGVCRAFGAERVSFVTPEQWKGSASKDACHRRLIPLLSSEEARHWPRSLDARDAIGIGLWSVGRYGT